jgi:hypothetical protein
MMIEQDAGSGFLGGGRIMNSRVLARSLSATTVAILLAFAPCEAAEKGGVDVQLVVSGDSIARPGNPFGPPSPYDPTQRDPRTVEVRIKNNSDRTVTLPAAAGLCGYAAEAMAHSVPGRTLRLRSLDKRPVDVIRVDPAKEATIFWARLDELLGGQSQDKDGKTSRKWGWDWELHPQPPASPIYLPGRAKEPKLASAVALWAEVTIDKQVLRSAPVLLRIGRSDKTSQPSRAIPPHP